jgi:hypothetical protein
MGRNVKGAHAIRGAHSRKEGRNSSFRFEIKNDLRALVWSAEISFQRRLPPFSHRYLLCLSHVFSRRYHEHGCCSNNSRTLMHLHAYLSRVNPVACFDGRKLAHSWGDQGVDVGNHPRFRSSRAG